MNVKCCNFFCRIKIQNLFHTHQIKEFMRQNSRQRAIWFGVGKVKRDIVITEFCVASNRIPHIAERSQKLFVTDKNEYIMPTGGLHHEHKTSLNRWDLYVKDKSC